VRTTRRRLTGDDGFVLLFVAVSLVGILLFVGLCLDGGRAYMVKAQLSKAVDAAALGAARSLNSGSPQADAAAIFKANFKSASLGTGATDPTTAANFYAIATDSANGINTVTITASVVMSTTLMTLANIPSVTVTSSAQATRRMVDLSLVIDVSSSIGSQWGAVRDAARTFVSAFDPTNDRVSLILFSNGANVLVPMNAARGFNKATVVNAIPTNLPGGSTLMVEGLYRGWDELRSVPVGSQSSLRVIVLFTDGASNGVPGFYDSATTAKALRTYDFPKNAIDPDGQTWDSPEIVGLFDTQSGSQSPSNNVTVPWNSTTTLTDGYDNYLPTVDAHTHSRSAGIPTSFALQTNTLMVNGVVQSTARGLRHFNAGVGKFPAEVWNINNAARNLVEIIANGARNDVGGAYPIRIYSIGMSYLVRDFLGTIPEQPEQILMRLANDPSSSDYNSAQLQGAYFYAATAADVGPAFQQLQNKIIRLSK
jgi:Flp pilus assembly protein TadG